MAKWGQNPGPGCYGPRNKPPSKSKISKIDFYGKVIPKKLFKILTCSLNHRPKPTSRPAEKHGHGIWNLGSLWSNLSSTMAVEIDGSNPHLSTEPLEPASKSPFLADQGIAFPSVEEKENDPQPAKSSQLNPYYKGSDCMTKSANKEIS